MSGSRKLIDGYVCIWMEFGLQIKNWKGTFKMLSRFVYSSLVVQLSEMECQSNEEKCFFLNKDYKTWDLTPEVWRLVQSKLIKLYEDIIKTLEENTTQHLVITKLWHIKRWQTMFGQIYTRTFQHLIGYI